MTFLLSLFFYINEPVAEMRQEPSIHAEVVSQAYFAEKVRIVQETNGWKLIETPDGYRGWLLSEIIVSSALPYSPNCTTSRLKAQLYSSKEIRYGSFLSLPYGTPLKILDDRDPRWIQVSLPDQKEAFIQKGDVAFEPFENLTAFSLKFLGIPYLWGGRTSFGYDCSGFVQMLYGKIGIQLQRNARQQILDSRFQDIPIDHLLPGDLIFFGRNENQITHVALSLGGTRFIHATTQENQPWIRISSLEDAVWDGSAKSAYSYIKARRLTTGKPLQN